MSLDPEHVYLHLRADGAIEVMDGGERFWSRPEAELDAVARDWLVAEFAFDADWPNWEMHPEGDEIVYLIEGAIDLLLEEPGGMREVPLRGRGACVVPRGVWHWARVLAPSRVLHVTRGQGSRHRPA